MLYITGDTHGSAPKWLNEIDPALNPGDIVFVAGDFGVGSWGDRDISEECFYDLISNRGYTVAFVDGNHENFDRLDAYPVEMWNGGRVHKIRGNIIHLMRGEMYNIEKKKIFTFGGAFSIDKDSRTQGIDWWPREMPCDDEYKNARNNLGKAGYEVDYIITHTASSESVFYLSSITPVIKRITDEIPLNMFLDEICGTTKYARWYFGHFHADCELWRGQTAVFNCLRELETGRIVRRWQAYESF